MITITSCSTPNKNAPAVLRVAGRLDSHASVTLLGSLEKLIEAGDHEIIIDFQELDAVSSEGLAALVQLKNRLSKLDGALRIANVHGAALEVFQLVHFDRLFELHPSIETAVQQFSIDRKANRDSDGV
jgi:anti-anti-sigma factor